MIVRGRIEYLTYPEAIVIPVRAVQVGGPLGAYLTEQHFDVPMTYEHLREIGAEIGHGGVVVFDDTVDMAEQARYAFEFCRRKKESGEGKGLLTLVHKTNVLTFASADLGNGTAGEQSVILAVSRVGIVLTIATMAFADRVGRRRIAVGAASAAVLFTLASALAPGLVVLAALQTVSRNLAIAGI